MPYIQCPVCNLYFELTEMRCGIVIHGYYAKSMKPINPHTNLARIRGRTVGCLSRLKITMGNDIYEVKKE